MPRARRESKLKLEDIQETYEDFLIALATDPSYGCKIIDRARATLRRQERAGVTPGVLSPGRQNRPGVPAPSVAAQGRSVKPARV